MSWKTVESGGAADGYAGATAGTAADAVTNAATDPATDATAGGDGRAGGSKCKAGLAGELMRAGALRTLLEAAQGLRQADLAFRNASVVQVLTGKIVLADVLVQDGRIAAVLPLDGIRPGPFERAAREERDLAGRFLSPGFIDAHVHIESSMVAPCEFARSVVPHGTTCVIADPHEIANVRGADGIRYMLEASRDVPLDIRLTLPSCVPATPFEHAGALLDAAALDPFYEDVRVVGLGEMMNVPGVLSSDPDVVAKLDGAMSRGLPVDGHAPELSGAELSRYAAAGISTDHECTTAAEAEERLALGMCVLLREGSAARNVLALLPAVTTATLDRCMFCTDDRNPGDILKEGHLDNNLRIAAAAGLDPVSAIRMASWNAARHYRLGRVGAIAPGWAADLVVLEDLSDFRVLEVWKRGIRVAESGRALFGCEGLPPGAMTGTMRMAPRRPDCLHLPPQSGMPVIGLRPRSLLTDFLRMDVRVENGRLFSRTGEPLLKLAVFERHHATGCVGVAAATGLGLRKGAIASTVAHDSHNLIVVGLDDRDMLAAVDALEACGGGIAIAENGICEEVLPLPIAGLMSDRPLEEVRDRLEAMQTRARALGVLPEHDPFMTLAFLALPVIPELKLTDMGLFDVARFRFIQGQEADASDREAEGKKKARPS